VPIAAFGKKVFQVSSSRIYTIGNLSWSGSLETESQEKLKSKPSTYIKGEALDTLSVEVVLRRDFKIDVRKEIEAWQAIKSKATPDYFILGTKPIGKNKWLLKSVGVSETQIDGKGNIVRAKLQLEFEEYVRAGKPQDKTKSARGGIVNLNLAPSSYLADPPNKAENKRNNPNAISSLNTVVDVSPYSRGHLIQ